MIDVPVSKANELLETEFSVYTHGDTGKQAIRTLSYSIPADLVGHLDLVHPTVTYAPLDLSNSPRSDTLLTASLIRISLSASCNNLSLIGGRSCSLNESVTVSTHRTV